MDDAQESPIEHEGTQEPGGPAEPGGSAGPGAPADPGAPWAPPPPPPLANHGGAWGQQYWPPPPGAGAPPAGNAPPNGVPPGTPSGWGSPSWPGQPPPDPWSGATGPAGQWSRDWSGDPSRSGDPGAPVGPGGSSGWTTPWPPGHDPSRPRRTLPSAITAVLVAVAVLVGLGLGHGVWRPNGSQSIGNGTGGNNSGGTIFGQNPFGGGAGSGPSNVGAIAAKASPALVDINTDLYQNNAAAAGTGIVLTSNGLVLTNNHVIAGATQIRATDIGNGKTYTAVVVGYDRSHDVALIQLQKATHLPTATIGDSSKVSVGDQVVGIGNAGGLGGTPSSAGGTVTALGQSITATDAGDGSSEQLAGLIQVNAIIQPGDSGGALVDTNGRVIGVDTAASAGFSFQTSGGEGFAIPINQATQVGRQIQSGQSTGGVHIGPTAFLGVLVNASNPNSSGATLAQAVPNGPAAQAGLAAGDTITSLAGHTVDKPSTLTNLILQYHPGDMVRVGWSDSSGQSHQSTVTLASGPPQ